MDVTEYTGGNRWRDPESPLMAAGMARSARTVPAWDLREGGQLPSGAAVTAVHRDAGAGHVRGRAGQRRQPPLPRRGPAASHTRADASEPPGVRGVSFLVVAVQTYLRHLGSRLRLCAAPWRCPSRNWPMPLGCPGSSSARWSAAGTARTCWPLRHLAAALRMTLCDLVSEEDATGGGQKAPRG